MGSIIRHATTEDVPIIADFNMAMAWETEHRRLEPDVVAKGVETIFREPSRGFYLVAEWDRFVVASLMITTEWSDWRNGEFWWIQSVYVLPQYRRRGIYRAMYAHVREVAGAHPAVCGFRLYVERDNRVAIDSYRALGMRETPYRVMEA